MDTKEIRALTWIKKFQPALYQKMMRERPDIIEAAYKGTGVAGIDGMAGVFDDIIDFGTKSVSLYQQNEAFKAQMKQASQTPVQQIQTMPAQQPLQVSGSGMLAKGGMIAAGVALATVAFFMLRGPKRRRR